MSLRVWVGPALIVVSLCSAPVTIRAAVEPDEGGSQMMIIYFASGAEPWRSIDDVVMGGVSHSTMTIEDGIAVFRGTVSLENNGGFASVRSEPAAHDLSAFDGLVLRLRGDGRRYGVRLRTTASFDGPSYQAMVEPEAGIWQEITIPFRDFEPVFRGRRIPGHPALDPSHVETFGLLIADKQAGPFQLEIAWIAGFREGA